MTRQGVPPLQLAILPLVLVMLLVGCATEPDHPPKFSCSVPTSKNISEAFEHAKRDLSHPQCQFQFEAYVDRLLKTAASNPEMENKKRFSELFAAARDQGILSRTQAQNYYRRYFTANFTSLDDRYNNCSTTCRNRDTVLKELKQELKDKDQGLLQAAGDKATYTQADKEYNQLLTLIEATCRACQNSR